MSSRSYKPMPYSRRQYPDSRPARREVVSRARYAPRAMDVVQRPVAAAYRRGASDRETKYFDTSFGGTMSTAADWTGSEVACTNYLQSDGTTLGAYTDSALIPSASGSGYGQVVGTKYRIKKLRIRGGIWPAVVTDSADVLQARFVRVVLVHDTQPNGAQAQGESVFPDMGDSTQCNFSFLAMGAGSGGRFRVLKDEFVKLDPGVAGADSLATATNSCTNQGAEFNFQYTPSKPIDVRIKPSSSTPTVASLSDCNIFLLAHCNTGVTSIAGCARVYYDD